MTTEEYNIATIVLLAIVGIVIVYNILKINYDLNKKK